MGKGTGANLLVGMQHWTCSLKRACAYIVGPADGPGAALSDLARSLGFATVQHYSSIASAELQSQRTPLMFFMFAAVEDVSSLRVTADAIRLSGSRRLRFSPLVYFAETPSMDAIQSCVEMGFDDVITLPFVAQRVNDRLVRMIDRTQIYFETSKYFGPDRGHFHKDASDAGAYRRIEIVRTMDAGISVVRDEIHHAA